MQSLAGGYLERRLATLEGLTVILRRLPAADCLTDAFFLPPAVLNQINRADPASTPSPPQSKEARALLFDFHLYHIILFSWFPQALSQLSGSKFSD
jgi:hypothetical protein